jgi:protein-tyrosine kinase
MLNKETVHSIGQEQLLGADAILDENKALALYVSEQTKQIMNMPELYRLDLHHLDRHRIIHAGMSNISRLNAYRDIRTKLLQLFDGSNATTLVVPAVDDPDLQKVCFNLAAVFALDMSKTSLILDTSAKQAVYHDWVGLERPLGLLNFLEGHVAGLDQIIYPVGISRLRMIPIGYPSDPNAEHFLSPRMAGLIEVLKRRYSDRYLFLNGAPVDISPDSRILAELVDWVIIVLPRYKISKVYLSDLVESIGRDKIAGIVMTDE